MSATKSANQIQKTLDPAAFSVGGHYGFNGFPKGDWRSATNPALLPAVHTFRALAEEAFDRFSRTELKNKSNLTRSLPGWHHEDFTNFYELSRERTLEFSLAWFTEFRQIANANRNLVPEDPTWWAHAQAHALLCQELAVPEPGTKFPFWPIREWTQYYCDGKRAPDASDTVETAEDFFRFATRSGWRAPKWLWAWARKYYGGDSAPWKGLKTEAASMEPLDQQETEKPLDRITKHFWLHIDYRFSEHVARVSVGDAKTGLTASTSSAAASSGQQHHDKTGAVAVDITQKSTEQEKIVFIERNGGRFPKGPISTISNEAWLNSFDELSQNLADLRILVGQKGSNASAKELRKCFLATYLGEVVNDKDQNEIIGTLRGGTTAKNAALVLLETKTRVKRESITVYCSEARTARKQKETGTINHH